MCDDVFGHGSLVKLFSIYLLQGVHVSFVFLYFVGFLAFFHLLENAVFGNLYKIGTRHATEM